MLKRVKVSELVFDFDIYPRYKVDSLDSTNLNHLRDAIRAGISLPPIIINEKDNRIVDGFHRARAVWDVMGASGEIDAEARSYKSDAEMFLEAGRLNCKHGLKMNQKDRAHFLIKAMDMGIPAETIAEALGMDVKRMNEFIEERIAKTSDGQSIPLPYGARRLAGKTLNKKQEHYARTANGCLPEMYARMLLNALNADVLELNEKTMKLLRKLYNRLGEILEENDG